MARPLPPELWDMDSPQFWSQFDRAVYSKTAQVLLDIFLAGGKVGTDLLPVRVRSLLSWEVFNQRAVDFLKLYRLNTVPDITEVTRRHAIQVIGDWIESGERFDMLVRRLEPWLGEKRAERIAVTEVTRTYASGNIAAWEATGVVEDKVWRTANDELVCPVCGPLNGQSVALGGNFMLDQNALPRALAATGEDYIYFQPPAHPRCRCWLAPVVSIEAIGRKARRQLEEEE